MKNLIKHTGVLLATIGIVLTSCEEENVVYDKVSGQTIASFSTSALDLGVPVEGASQVVSVTASTENSSERMISYEIDPSSTATPDQYTITTSNIAGGEFTGTITIEGNFAALPEEGTRQLIINLTDVSNSNDLTFGTGTLTISLFRQCDMAPTPGVWTINMEDSYGDGWQTTSNNGGPGLTVTLNDGTVFEVGLCTPYEDNEYDCTNEGSSGSTTITIPEGTESAEWFFPGDNWGEISFSIVAPNGNVVYAAGPDSPAGVFEIDFCAQ